MMMDQLASVLTVKRRLQQQHPPLYTHSPVISMKTPFTFVVTDDIISDDEVVEQLQRQGKKSLKVPDKKDALLAVIAATATVIALCPEDLRASLQNAIPSADIKRYRCSAAEAAASFNSVGKVLRLWMKQQTMPGGAGPPWLPPRSGNGNNNTDDEQDNDAVAAMPAMTALKKIHDEYEHCFQAARIAKMDDLQRLVLTEPPVDPSRKFNTKQWEMLQGSQCLFCLHWYVDGPAVNAENFQKNLKAMEDFQKEKRLHEAAAGGTSTTKPKLQNPTIANKGLLPLPLECHCHQHNNLGLGNNTCPECLAKESHSMVADRSTCKVCQCPCKMAWESSKSQEIAVSIAQTTLGHGGSEITSRSCRHHSSGSCSILGCFWIDAAGIHCNGIVCTQTPSGIIGRSNLE
jgi:hypothetical protein